MNSEIIKIYCGVKYEDKDRAKKLGAKWDTVRKGWYFQFNINEFLKNEELNTFQFKPFSLSSKQSINHKTYDLIYDTAKNRNIKYINDNQL